MTACQNPTPFEKLVALWTGDLADAEAAALEEHLFQCDRCSDASDELGKLIGSLRELIPPVLSHALRDRLVGRGVRVLHTPVESNVSARARYVPDVDLLVHVLKGDLSHAERVDVEILTPDGVPRLRFEAVPFDARAGEVLVACQRHYEVELPGDPTFRLHAVEGGVERCVGQYFVFHEWR